MSTKDEAPARRRSAGRHDWSSWPQYDGATFGLPGRYWYPVMWSAELRGKPTAVEVVGKQVMLYREKGRAYALHDRCPHRGVPLSMGDQQFPGTISCPYHGWTFDLESGVLRAAITDGPDSPLCGKVGVATYPVEERLGLVWLFIGSGDDEEAEGEPPPIETAIPMELLDHDFAMGGNMEIRTGGWRFAAENGFDEGHAKYLHRNSLWRTLKVMPTWTKTKVEATEGRWITRVQQEVHWAADFPGLGTWSGDRWWKRSGSAQVLSGTVREDPKADPVISSLNFPGQQSIQLPGRLRIVHAHFIHYEWYVPVDEDRYRYVQMMVEFKTGLAGFLFKLRYVTMFRWLFHGQFSHQDKFMVDVINAPPERLYRPDISITAWRRLCERASPHGEAVVAGMAAGNGAQHDVTEGT